MLDCEFFYKLLKESGITFFSGVPDSLLKSFCAYVADHAGPSEHVIASNEGAAVGLAAGHHLATGSIPVVYMQNSGQGNALNPLLSLADQEVYSIPLLLIVGWRGEPGKHDEPQHIKQGRVMNSVFDSIGLTYDILSDNQATASAQVQRLLSLAKEENRPVALIVKKETFSPYTQIGQIESQYCMTRESAICEVAAMLPDEAVIVSTTGHISRELYTFRKKESGDHHKDFLMVGSMGHASQVALGMALARPDIPVYCFDGDGALLMHLGGLALVGQSGCKNLKHIVFNNGAHGSVGGQPTVALSISFTEMAKASGYGIVSSASDSDSLSKAMEHIAMSDQTSFLEIRVALGARKDLIRPSESPIENKQILMKFVDDNR